MIGETISRYRITEKLGEGGMGVVYKAEDLKLGRAVALKFLPPHLLESEEHKARFLHEARAVAAFDHPTICTIHEIDEAEGRTFLAMAWLQGATLKKKIAQRPLPLGEALDIAIQIGQGLQAAHAKGVVHRDIKPANIMITTEGHAKIMDFGLAQLSDCTKLTATGTKLGTPAYMSPEQTEGKSTDQRCDIWALGVVLYEMATGQLPFKGEAEAAVAYAIVHTDPEPLTALRSGLPIELDRIVEKALTKDPAERYQHIEDMVVDLMRLRQVLDSAPRRQPANSRRPWAIALGLLALGVAITYAIFQRSDAPTPFEGWRVRRITTTAALDLGASASPQSNLVAYSGAAAGNFDIYVMPASGGEPHQLTTHLADDTHPRFSPDGQEIAFLSGRDGGGVYLIPVTGGEPRLLANTHMSAIRPRLGAQPWRDTPQGRELLFSRRRENGQLAIWKVNISSFEEVQLSQAPEDAVGDADASWSPDGESIAFVRQRSGRFELSVMPANGGAARLLLENARMPSWTSDGKRLVFSSDRSGHINLWELTLTSGAIRQLTVGSGRDVHPAPAGGMGLLYTEFQHTLNLYRVDIQNAEDHEQLTSSSEAEEVNPRFSRDGRYLAFDTNERGNHEIVRIEVKTKQRRFLTDNPAQDSHPDWSPVTDELVFISDRAGAPALWLMDMDGRNVRRIPVDPNVPSPFVFLDWRGDAPPRWSPDGSLIGFVALGAKGPEFWTVRRDGSGAQRLLSGVFSFDWYGLDGRVIVYSASRPGSEGAERELRAVHLDTKKEAELLRGLYGNLIVSPDRKTLACVSQHNHMDQQFFLLPLTPPDADGLPRAAGPLEQLTKSDGLWHVQMGDFSPDGKYLVYDRDTDRGDIFLLENYR